MNVLKIPDRWLACPQRSKLIANKFVVFKTPLDSRYDMQVGKHQFNLDTLQKSLEESKLKLKMVIDMTNTDRYYDSSILSSKGIIYYKIKCIGKEEAPDEEAKVKFVEEVNKVEESLKEGEVIGVHCTHGFNRSGFMVVSYLVEQYDCCLDSAIVEFTNARYPGIYKEDYINKLCEVYHMERAEVPKITSNLPSWVTDKDSNEHPEIYNTTKAFMDGLVRGVDTVIDVEEVLWVQKAVQDICGWKKSGFPGGQPVSMSVKNVEKLSEMPYMVSWKADGTRYLMYIEKEGSVYLLDRDNTVFKPRVLKFPWKDGHLYDSLLDGEVVIDVDKGVKTPRFLAFDIIKLQDEMVGDGSLESRQKCISCIVDERNRKVDKTMEPFSLRLKSFWPISNTVKLMADKFQKGLFHEMDGLIFQPANEPYLKGQCEDILKWKPPGLNSVDFKAKINEYNKRGFLKVKQLDLYCSNTCVFGIKYTKALKKYDNKIIECSWDAEGKTWKFMRVRTDKSYPNAYETFQSICQTINHPVTQEYLLSYIANIQANKRPLALDHNASQKSKRQKTTPNPNI